MSHLTMVFMLFKKREIKKILTWVNLGVLSVCWPTLCAWLRLLGSAWQRARRRRYISKLYLQSSMQLWIPQGSDLTLLQTQNELMPQKAKPWCLISAPHGCGLNELSSVRITDQWEFSDLSWPVTHLGNTRPGSLALNWASLNQLLRPSLKRARRKWKPSNITTGRLNSMVTNLLHSIIIHSFCICSTWHNDRQQWTTCYCFFIRVSVVFNEKERHSKMLYFAMWILPFWLSRLHTWVDLL